MDDEKKAYLLFFGSNIKKLRIERNLSQEELARLCGYDSRSSINKIELGINDVPASKVKLLAKALNVDIEEILKFDKFNKIQRMPDDEQARIALDLFMKLDALDKSKVIERMETLLEQDKYFAKEGSSENQAI